MPRTVLTLVSARELAEKLKEAVLPAHEREVDLQHYIDEIRPIIRAKMNDEGWTPMAVAQFLNRNGCKRSTRDIRDAISSDSDEVIGTVVRGKRVGKRGARKTGRAKAGNMATRPRGSQRTGDPDGLAPEGKAGSSTGDLDSLALKGQAGSSQAVAGAAAGVVNGTPSAISRSATAAAATRKASGRVANGDAV